MRLPEIDERIDDASFAMDDVILYLDTHPDDRNALNYYRYVVALRKEAVKAYEASFGPLTIEDADDACTWSWLTERWPWEGRCSVCGDMKKDYNIQSISRRRIRRSRNI